jgi:hypothetical protein
MSFATVVPTRGWLGAVKSLAFVMRLKGFTAGWTNASICVEGAAVSINGLSPWSLSWQRTSEELIIVPHPNYATERHKAWVHEIEDNAKRIRFAACELSNGVWGFIAQRNECNSCVHSMRNRLAHTVTRRPNAASWRILRTLGCGR